MNKLLVADVFNPLGCRGVAASKFYKYNPNQLKDFYYQNTFWKKEGQVEVKKRL